MKKIKILHGFVIVLVLIFTFSFLVNYFYVYKHFEGKLYKDVMINLFFSILIIVGLFFIQSALYTVIKKDFFSIIAGKRFKIAGLFFLISGFGEVVFNILRFRNNLIENSHVIFSNFTSDFLLVMIGYSLFILIDFIKSGNILKQENDLTI